MSDARRADLTARAFVTLGALLPYWRLLTFRTIYVTDDGFASDIFNGELPGRVLIADLIRHGQWPVWTSQLCSGFPLAGSPADPIGLAAFSLLRPAAALDLVVLVLLLVAGHGAYGLARRVGADRTGAVLAGIAFAVSGYIVCQLRHLAIISTIAWLPVGLLLIHRALTPVDAGRAPTPTGASRALLIAAFGLVFAEQALSGFPQSAYICALVYGSFALFAAIANRHRFERSSTWLTLLAGIGIAGALGAAAGAVVLLPLSTLGNVSDRAHVLGWDWATIPLYWRQNILTFLVPYINGDISNDTYIGHPVFWEDYGYVGVGTFLLAIYGAIRERRRPAGAFWIVTTLVAYFFVLGRSTPVYRLAYLLVPGMKVFRVPTRYLVVVDLGLALLAALGLTHLRREIERRQGRFTRAAPFVAAALVAATALDLQVHQPRQNPMVPAKEWLAPPPTVAVVRAGVPEPRTFTPGHRDLHRLAFHEARGWTTVAPYFELRDVLEPNIGGSYWSLPSADCYAGIAPRWHVDVWSDHNRTEAMISPLAVPDPKAAVLRTDSRVVRILAAYGVTHVLSLYPQRGAALTLAGRGGNTYVYRVDGAARARFVPAARRVRNDEEAVAGMLDASFDPDREILLQDAPSSTRPTVEEARLSSSAAPSRVVVTREGSRQLVIDATAPQDGFLLLADTFYPGWTADVDGSPTPIYRANVSVRGIALPKGRHEVRFVYDPPGFFRGLQMTLVSLSVLLVWLGLAAYSARRVHD